MLALGVANRAAYWFDIQNAQPLNRPDVTVAANPADASLGATLNAWAELYANCQTQDGLSFVPRQVASAWITYLNLLQAQAQGGAQ